MLVLAKERPVALIETDLRSARLLPLAVGMLALRLMSPTSCKDFSPSDPVANGGCARLQCSSRSL